MPLWEPLEVLDQGVEVLVREIIRPIILELRLAVRAKCDREELVIPRLNARTGSNYVTIDIATPILGVTGHKQILSHQLNLTTSESGSSRNIKLAGGNLVVWKLPFVTFTKRLLGKYPAVAGTRYSESDNDVKVIAFNHNPRHHKPHHWIQALNCSLSLFLGEDHFYLQKVRWGYPIALQSGKLIYYTIIYKLYQYDLFENCPGLINKTSIL